MDGERDKWREGGMVGGWERRGWQEDGNEEYKGRGERLREGGREEGWVRGR